MMKKVLLAGVLAALVLTGCEKAEDAKKAEDSRYTEQVTEAQEQEETEEEEAVSEIFQSFPDSFTYSSGAGAWATELYLNDDGTFTGEFHDTDAGAADADYPNGTVYISKFHGKFTEPQVVSEYAYSMSVESMELDLEEGLEYVEDGIRYIVVGESELETGEQLMVYVPDTPYQDMPDGFLGAIPSINLGPETLYSYAIYNEKYDAYYTGFRFLPDEDIKKLSGSYQTENGDRVNINISDQWETFEVGTIEWMPVDEESQIGHIHRDGKGGILFTLDESLTYSFELTNNEAGAIEFVGVGKYAFPGTFVMTN